MNKPTHDGTYLVATCDEYGLDWFVADHYYNDTFFTDEGCDVPIADCYKWFELPQRKEELDANPKIPCLRPSGQ